VTPRKLVRVKLTLHAESTHLSTVRTAFDSTGGSDACGLTHECSCDAHNGISGVQHAGILAAILHAAVDAGEHSMPRVDKGTEAKGDWQAVQMQWGGLGKVDTPLDKTVHHYSCSRNSKTFSTCWVQPVHARHDAGGLCEGQEDSALTACRPGTT